MHRVLSALQVYVKQLADKELDTTKSYKGQQSASLRKVCLQVRYIISSS